MTQRKDKINKAFSGAAETYDKAAHVQRHYAAKLAASITGDATPDAAQVLEVGCGTGALTRELLSAIPGDEALFLVTDISPDMVAAARSVIDDPRVNFDVVDGEAPPKDIGAFDLIISNLTFQWFTDLPGTLEKLSALLVPGGRLAFTTLGSQSFAEWRAAHDALGLSCGIPDFPEAPVLSQMLPKCGGGLVTEELTAYPFIDAFAFARSLKDTGAYVPVSGHKPLSPAAFRNLAREIGDDFSVSYHLLSCDFIKEQETQV